MVCDKCRPEFEELLKRIVNLEKRLSVYENANTPSSKIRFPPRIINETKNQPGQKNGHDGTTRPKPNSTMTIEVVEDKCPCCQSKLGDPIKTLSKTIEEIPDPQPIEVTEYRVNHYFCPNCNRKVIAKAPIPRQSRFGIKTLAHVTLLKFEDRLPLRKVCSALKRQFDLKISSGTVFDMTHRVSNSLSNEYFKIRNALRTSKSVNVDETGIRVGGLNFYVWVFTTKKSTLYIIRKSRGKGVIEEILGEKYKGVIGCDGWTSYVSYSNNLQRCWAHLLREAKYLAREYDSAKPLYAGLKSIYRKATKKKPPNKDILIMEIEQWIDYSSSYKELRKFATKIKNGIEYWFTFLSNKGVEPTNNSAERALRELIVQRKIIGTLRNVKGTTIMERITSCIATWKQQGLNPFTELKAQLC